MVMEILRYAVFGAVALSGLAALGSWAVRSRKIGPFSKSAQLIRRTTDPVLQPIERMLHERGGNPQNAEWWLAGGALLGGTVLLSFASWAADRVALIGAAMQRGPFAMVRLSLYFATQLVTLAIFARVIGSWLGVGRYNKFMKPAYVLTDWLIEPIRKILPPVGMFDFSPLVALIIMWIIGGLI
jgi:YggT family protein